VTYVPVSLRREVQRRAKRCCEYCRLHEEDAYFGHEPDHIIAEKHQGQTEFENLAWSCFDCNRFKGSDISSIDPATSKLVPLFNPRIDLWEMHFRISGPEIHARSDVGRVTEQLLRLNLAARVEVRRHLIRLGRYRRK